MRTEISMRDSSAPYRCEPRRGSNTGFDVAMHDARAMRVGQRLGDVDENRSALGDTDAPTFESLPEGFTADERHRVIRKPAVGDAGRQHGNDVRLLQTRRDPNLLREPLGRNGAGELGVEDFHNDVAAEHFVARDEDARHAASAEVSLQGVCVAEACFEIAAKLGAHRARGQSVERTRKEGSGRAPRKG